MLNLHDTKAANWNIEGDSFTQAFWEQNIRQFWKDTEIPVSKDKQIWATLSPEEKRVYQHVLGGLTLLDTRQASEGMPLISLAEPDPQRKAVLGFMGMMESMHAKSYSRIFMTLNTSEEINKIFEWVDNNPYLTAKVRIITDIYRNLGPGYNRYQSLVASVFLESFLFYSGFFYPLYLAGQGKMVHSGEIISLILRDEAIHGVYIGLLAQEVFQELIYSYQDLARGWASKLLRKLYDNELEYTREIYGSIGLTDEVNKFLRYNANKAMMNLGLDPIFEPEDINPIVENALNLETKNHDFFSTKGNGYISTLNIQPITDQTFNFYN